MENSTGGRPTKYNPSFVEELDKYLAKLSNGKRCLPTVEGFAIHLGIDADTVNNWVKARVKDEQGNKTKKLLHPEFCRAIKRLKTIQKEKLINDGLYGGREVNCTMAIFLLKVNHGMVEKSQADITTQGEKLPIPILGGLSVK
ncbi:MAG: hypothetical protein PHV63_02695 [Candidatus Daviesbacteria bacterium]|nr:hypothetical protein [Candidatus Daviesbacteria bacterium]